MGPVAGTVVRQDSFDHDATIGEIGVGLLPELGSGLLLLICEDLGIRQPGVIIDSVV